jgi:hypothetical protein
MQLSKPLIMVIALVVVATTLTAYTLATLNVNKNLSSSGTITTSPNLGVFSDSACTINMTAINWGSVSAGGTANQVLYVQNTGTGTLTLSLTTSNWSPLGAGTYLTMSWNQQGTQLPAGQSVAATITLTVSSSITGISSFSNSIAITGSG